MKKEKLEFKFFYIIGDASQLGEVILSIVAACFMIICIVARLLPKKTHLQHIIVHPNNSFAETSKIIGSYCFLLKRVHPSLYLCVCINTNTYKLPKNGLLCPSEASQLLRMTGKSQNEVLLLG